MTEDDKKAMAELADKERAVAWPFTSGRGPKPGQQIFTIMPSVKQSISFFGAQHDTILFVTEEGEFQWCENPDEAILAMEQAGTNKPIAALLRRLRDYEYSV
jgi:hypothetical protein